MEEARAEIEINAPPERVWQVLTDFASYSAWNPFITQASGAAKTDAGISLRVSPPQSRAVSVKARVLQCVRHRELRWRGNAWGVSALFEGEHSCTIEPLPDGRSRLTQQQRVGGLLASVLGSTAERTQQGLEAMNQALKARVEGNPQA